MRTIGLIAIGIVVGSAATVGSLALEPKFAASLFDEETHATLPEPEIVHCAAELDTAGWLLFKNTDLGYQFRYPASFQAEETTEDKVVLRPLAPPEIGVPTAIGFEKLRGNLNEFMEPSMLQAGWKIADRQTYALSTPYFSDPDHDGRLWSTYLFVRDFPLQSKTGSTYVMVRATLQMDEKSPDFDAARNAGIVDLENMLTLPEQVLSTFRFLTYEELQ